MMKRNLVKGCMVLLFICATGCGQTAEPATEGNTVETTQMTTETTEMTEATTENTADKAAEDTQAATTQAENADLGSLSDDLFSYQIMINGELYQIPMEFSDLTAKGWKYDGDENEELDAYTYIGAQTFKMGDYDVEADLANLTDSPQPYSACKIVGIAINKSYNWQEDNDMTFILPMGIQSGVATMEDVKKAYGEPAEEYGEDGIIMVRYEEEYANKQIIFTFHDGILGDIDIKNFEQ